MKIRGWAKKTYNAKPIKAELGSGSVAFPQGLVENAEVWFAFYDEFNNEKRLSFQMNEQEARDFRDKLQNAIHAIDDKRLRQAKGET